MISYKIDDSLIYEILKVIDNAPNMTTRNYPEQVKEDYPRVKFITFLHASPYLISGRELHHRPVSLEVYAFCAIH